jgi:hypothetical protein
LPPGCHQNWIAESLYSNPLSEQVRQDKVRALAAMAAVVRGSHGTSVRERTLSRIAGLVQVRRVFLRRAPSGPNELFYRVQGSRPRGPVRRPGAGIERRVTTRWIRCAVDCPARGSSSGGHRAIAA